MATMVLKDTLLCPECGEEMFPCAFDRQERKITYRCSETDCGMEKECSFDEAKLEEGENFIYFCLNDDGEVTWKCFIHAYCEYDIDFLLEKDITKFQRCCCVLGRDVDEIEEDMKYAENAGKSKISRILAALGEEHIPELAKDMLFDIELDFFDGDYLEAFASQAMINEDGVDDFIYQMLDQIYELFEISLDEEGNPLEITPDEDDEF
ncbi:MAG: hypothetical protein Q4B50_03430 [Bacillota bacterium]|nr:hypothetical protein [Bacillota bacterium]